MRVNYSNGYYISLGLSLFGGVVLFCVMSERICQFELENKNLTTTVSTLHKDLDEAHIKILDMKIKALNAKPKKRYKEMEMRVTAYCPCKRCCAPHADGITSVGNDAYQKGVAVDPSVIPYGSVLDIPGYGVVEADDAGGAIKQNRLDVRFKTHQEALNWGVKYLTVKVYPKTKGE